VVDLRCVDLNLLVSLDAVLEERNVTRAAERLHLSQSSVSAQLARLRQVFGDPLLIPAKTGRGMVPTARALALVGPLKAALRGLEGVVRGRPTFDPMSECRSFQIAATDYAVVVLGLPLMDRLETVAGTGVRLAFRNVEPSRIAEQMERGEVDLLIGSERMVPATMKTRKVLTERFLMAQRKGHPRGRKALDLGSYCKLRHILVSTSGGSFHGFMDEHLEALKKKREVVLSVQQFTLVPEILRTTDYVCTLPSRLIQRFACSLDGFKLPFKTQGFALYAAWHTRNQQDPATKWLRDLVASCGGVPKGVESSSRSKSTGEG
jgi:DNA-binding transcriptional LysR family regulator